MSEELAFGENFEFKGEPDEGKTPSTSFKNQWFKSEEIVAAIDGGMGATKVELCYEDGVRFMVDADLVLTRIRFPKEILNSAAENAEGDPLATADATALLVADKLSEIAAQLATAVTTSPFSESSVQEEEEEKAPTPDPFS